MRRERWMWVMAWLLAASPAAGQFPGSVSGVVVDGATGGPVAGALVELPAAGRAVRTDAAGTFHLRGVDAGAHRLTVRRAGYAGASVEAAVRDGSATRVTIRIYPDAVRLAELRVSAGAERAAGEARMERDAIAASGARDLAEVLERSGAVQVTGAGPTGARHVSIRGSAADAVLVLVDGVALNDPVTGEADLSQLPAGAIQRVTVLSGAQSSRYGPRAEAGVVLVETRAPESSTEVLASGGSLGERAGRAEYGYAGRAGGLAVGVHARAVEGDFGYVAPFTGEPSVRRNADLGGRGGWAAGAAPAAGGTLRFRAGWDGMERGVPGPAFRLTPYARQESGQGRASLSWRRTGPFATASLTASGELRRVHHFNPAPPDSFPYDSRVQARTGTVRAEASGSGSRLSSWAIGADATAQHVEAGSLSEAAPAGRMDAGLFAGAATGRRMGRWDATLAADGRLDRDGMRGDLFATHTVALSLATGATTLRLAQRSAFSPPTLGDQFFQEGVGVAPNPDLRAERIPSEWEASASGAASLGSVEVQAGGAAFTGAVRGMIIWSPDFRGIWSPRNADVERRGAELWMRLAARDLPVTLGLDWGTSRVVYDWESAQRVQVVYRPRSTGAVRAGWSDARWRAEISGAYTGWRNPTRENSNRLPGFWTMGARLGRTWRMAGSMLDLTLDVDRLGGERDALIFGHPEPGRRVRLDLRLRGAGKP